MMSFFVSDTDNFKLLVINKLNTYITTSYPEKVYVHTDKTYYVAGEDLWFNAYLVNGVTHQKSNKSKVVYVELINELDSVVISRKLFTEENRVKGDIELPIKMKAGKYVLRAYTHYMKNEDQSFFFQKEIPIFSFTDRQEIRSIDSINTTSSKLRNPTRAMFPNIEFYPEGGYLIEGLTTKVAIKDKNQSLSSPSIVGFIEDTQGNWITDFKTFEFGLGSFFLKPEPNKTYRAVIETEHDRFEYQLPTALKTGHTMSVLNIEKELRIDVKTNLKNGLHNSFIIAHQRGIIAFERTLNTKEKCKLLKVPNDILTSGILTITLFNNDKKPVAERLIYINREKDKVDIKIKPNAESFTIKDKVHLNIQVENAQGQVLPSTFSMAVRNTDIVPQDIYSENIKTYLLLNSDLRGNIESPSYFFQKGDTIKKAYLLDLAMLTHGWRRFTWQELLEEKSKAHFEPEKGLYIKGVTVSTEPPYLQKAANTRLTFKRHNGLYQEMQKTAINGVFQYGPFVHHTPIDIVIEASTDTFSLNALVNRTSVGILLKDTIVNKVNIVRNPTKKKTIISEEVLDKFLKQSEHLAESRYYFDKDREQLNEITIQAKRKNQASKRRMALNKRTRYGTPSHRIIVEDLGFTGAVNFLDLLANLPGVYVRSSIQANSNDPQVTIRGLRPAFYLNGVKVPFDYLIDLNSDEIEFIDVLTGSNAMAFGLEAQGVIVVYTMGGSSRRYRTKEVVSNTINFQSEGFYSAREFYSPNYANEFYPKNLQDLRSTLYWDASLATSKKDKTIVSFYTCDEKGNYIIEIEGITNTGIPFYNTAMFEVQ